MKIESEVMFKSLRKWFLRKTPLNGVRRISSIFGALASDIGVGRDENQDRAAIVRSFDFQDDPYTLVLISDGMGGMKDGGVCAATTMAAFLTSFFVRSKAGGKASEWLPLSALDANNTVFNQYFGRGGATLSALLLREDGSGGIINVGDTRVYGYDGGSIIQLTVDDTIAGQLGDKLGSLKVRNELLQFIGMGSELEPHYLGFIPSGLKSFVLTTDGVHYLDKNLIKDIVANADDPGVCVKRLVDVAKWCGGKDNCSSVMLSVEKSAYSVTEDADKNLFEIWDSYGELQVFYGGSEADADTKRPAIEKNRDLKNWLQLAEKSSGKGRKNTASKKNVGYGSVKKSEKVDGDSKEEGVVEDAPRPKDKNAPQLKISFPSKE